MNKNYLISVTKSLVNFSIFNYDWSECLHYKTQKYYNNLDLSDIIAKTIEKNQKLSDGIITNACVVLCEKDFCINSAVRRTITMALEKKKISNINAYNFYDDVITKCINKYSMSTYINEKSEIFHYNNNSVHSVSNLDEKSIFNLLNEAYEWNINWEEVIEFVKVNSTFKAVPICDKFGEIIELEVSEIKEWIVDACKNIININELNNLIVNDKSILSLVCDKSLLLSKKLDNVDFIASDEFTSYVSLFITKFKEKHTTYTTPNNKSNFFKHFKLW